MESLPLIVVVGPTASGKTGLSIKIAQQYNGEIISADSRAIYEGMDIGTAKPSMEERQGVPHWGFDLVKPGERYTAAEFKDYAHAKIKEIRSHGRIPILVGGTGLYVDAVIFDYAFPPATGQRDRARWEKKSLADLHEYCHKNNIMLPENSMNKRYVINTILRNGHALKMSTKPLENTIIVGITTKKEELRARITHRTEAFFDSGVLQEAMRLAGIYGWENEAMTGNIYPLVKRYAAGEISLAQMKELFNVKEWQLAKRQLTWLKRNEHIKWLPLSEAYTYLAQVLDNSNKS